MGEELSAEVTVGKFIMVEEHQYPLFKIILYAFFCTIASGSLEISEHVDFIWSVPDKLLMLDWAAADRPVMNRVNELINSNDIYDHR